MSESYSYPTLQLSRENNLSRRLRNCCSWGRIVFRRFARHRALRGAVPRIAVSCFPVLWAAFLIGSFNGSLGYSQEYGLEDGGVWGLESFSGEGPSLRDQRGVLDYSEVLSIDRPGTLSERILQDHRNYYSPQILAGLSFAFAGGALLANTELDREIYEDFQHSVTNASSDEWLEGFHAPKELGNGIYTLPIFALAWSTTLIGDSSTGTSYVTPVVSQWGERSLRSFLVGAPPVILMQKVVGGSRPEEGTSHWRFWDDSNGVSGHSFMGALPFLTAARLSENRLARYGWYAASTIVPLSRVSDGDHYASQAFLGWSMALAATIAIDQTDSGVDNWHVLPLFSPGQVGLGIEHRW